jgi:trans-2-enoyl-CoA reductase
VAEQNPGGGVGLRPSWAATMSTRAAAVNPGGTAEIPPFKAADGSLFTDRFRCHARPMRSAERLIFRRTGVPFEVLELETFRPAAGPGEVLVRMLAAPINPADLNLIEGTYGIQAELPGCSGTEGCGEVEQSDAAGFAPGDRVILLRRIASWASHVVVPAADLLKIPAELDPLQAAMLKVNPATAWLLLREFAQLRPGDAIIQNVANSGVGRCVIQLARELGVRTVSFARRPEIFDELRQLGGDHIFSDDADGHAGAKDVLGGANAVLAFNAVGGESALRLMKLLAPGGTHITYGAMARKPLTVPNGLLIFRDIRVRGFWVSRWIDAAAHTDLARLCGELAQRMVAGNLLQPVDSTYSLQDVRAALKRLEAPDRNGKVLLVPVQT